MKAFIDRIFKAKKQKKLLNEIVNTEVIKENKKILAEQIETSIKKHVEEVEEVKEVIKKEEVKKEEVVIYPQPNHFSGCNCFKCVRWKNQN
jgi:hypothetical protein